MNNPTESNRTLVTKRRLDLKVEVDESTEGRRFVIKDPVSQRYFRLTPESWFVLEQLDGKNEISQILSMYHERFAPQQIELSQLERLVYRFMQDGLVHSQADGQGEQLFFRGRKEKQRELAGKLSNVLAVRFRGIDPERLLVVLNRYVGWVFSKYCVAVVLLIAAMVAIFMLSRFDEVTARLPELSNFFQIENIALFFVVFSLTKILHEFGHGISCKKLGGECHEIGFMLLVMTPCLFCNVSDCWMLKNKWHRAAISAAGMYVELILATIAALVWLNTTPGLLNMVALQVMILCSISTIAFNANPLLRFDGYYIVSDLLEIPNLMQRSTDAMKHMLARSLFGYEESPNEDLSNGKRIPFVIYALTSTAYRVVVIVAIFSFLCVWLEPMGLKSVGIVVACFAICSMAYWPITRLFKKLSIPGQSSRFNFRRTATALCFLLLVGSAIVFVPFPQFVTCEVVMMPANVESVHAGHAGHIEEVFVEAGQFVEEGELIARLKNDSLEIELLELNTQLEQAKARRRLLLGATETRSQVSLEMVDQSINRLNETIAILDKEYCELEIKSQSSGVLTVVNRATDQPAFNGQARGFVDGDLLSINNRGVYVEYTTHLGDIVGQENWKAVVIISKEHLDLVSNNRKAKIRLHSNPFCSLETTIDEIGVSANLLETSLATEAITHKKIEQQLGSNLENLVTANEKKNLEYLGMGSIKNRNCPIRMGDRGKALVYCGNRSLGSRLSRYVSRNFL